MENIAIFFLSELTGIPLKKTLGRGKPSSFLLRSSFVNNINKKC